MLRPVPGLAGKRLERGGGGDVEHGPASSLDHPGQEDGCTGRRRPRRRCGSSRSRAARSLRCTGPVVLKPALLTSTSTVRPRSARVAREAGRAAASVRSSAITSVRTPWALSSSSARSVSLASRRATSVTPCARRPAPGPDRRRCPRTRRSRGRWWSVRGKAVPWPDRRRAPTPLRTGRTPTRAFSHDRGRGPTLGPCPTTARSSSWGPGPPDWRPPWRRPGPGADVLVLERAPAVGGTTAMSGGVVWMPAHGRAGLTTVIDDSIEDALDLPGRGRRGRRRPRARRGLRGRHAPGGRRDRTAHAARVGGARALARLPRRAARRQDGRTFVVAPAAAPGAGDRRRVSKPPSTSRRRRPSTDPAAPANDGVVLRGHVRGRALVGGLLAGARRRRRRGPHRGARHRARRRGRPGGGRLRRRAPRAGERGARLRGASSTTPGWWVSSSAGRPSSPWDRRAVPVTACAWPWPSTPLLGNTSEAWWMPAMHAPGEHVDGVRHFRPLHAERAQPGAIMVDRAGRRFVDEAQNYGDVGRAMRGWRLAEASHPGAAVVVGLRRRLSAPLPRGPARAGRARPPLARPRRRSRRAGAAHRDRRRAHCGAS